MAAQSTGPLRILGRYALYNEIAAGGMATVHIGRLLGPVGFARTVAIKRLHPQYAKDPEFASMFLDEARLAARVQHPNVVATIDVVATDGELFLIMDYVRGESLSRLVRTAKKQGELVPPRIAAAIICGFLHGLHSAHEAKDERGERLNLVHRDVSPQNVLVGADGIARVLDFGIAKAAGRVQVTKDGQIKGKLAYMPPEQLAGRELSRAVDIYASAVVMWETLTGERLFKGESESETLAKILRDPVPPPSMVEPRIPQSFDAPLLKALSREANRRHATARELALELERCVGMASPTEVGEWVERIVGPILSSRENQIAAIESQSAAMRTSPSGRPQYAESPSDTDMHAIPSSRRSGTLLGMGAGVGTGPVSNPHAQYPAPSSSNRGVAAAPPREDTGSKVSGTKMTGTMSLPVDRKLPLIATAIGLVVLLGIVGFVILRKSGDEAVAPVPSSSAAGVTSAAPSMTASAAPPPPSTETASDPVPPPPPPSASVAGTTATPKQPHVTVRPPPVTPVKPNPSTPPATTTTKKNCDPPYTIDSTGRRKYKLECM